MTDALSKPRRRTLYAELTKIRLSALVLVTAGVGYLLGVPEGVNWIDAAVMAAAACVQGDFAFAGEVFAVWLGSLSWLHFLLTMAGIGLAAAGTSAVNQWMEIDRDGAMDRTKQRPLPSGAMERSEALVAGSLMVVGGSAIVFFGVNPLAGFLTLLTATIYILVYTPLKPRTSLNTLVGAVCGALPPMIGWAAAAEALPLGAWLLGAVLFVWQLPHFLALAWMYRDDYRRGGFRMLPVNDAGGELTARVVVLTAAMLLPLSLMIVIFGVAGLGYAVVAGPLGVLFVIAAFRMYQQRSIDRARTVFLTSILYLPLLCAAMTIDQQRPPLRAIMFDADLRIASAAMPE